MSLINTIKNTLRQIKGNTRRTTGRVTADRDLEVEGAEEQTGDHLKQAGENVKGTVR
ncbi:MULTISPECIES: CsbD family protein [unclassified Frankia]|uniref:CsbD family protein n=1 Tax=unclassified Frankia TaxID=2632575 RepID=UPI002AD32F84|nr:MULTISPECIES: CsbD family protein [unclassified Frankia]